MPSVHSFKRKGKKKTLVPLLALLDEAGAEPRGTSIPAQSPRPFVSGPVCAKSGQAWYKAWADRSWLFLRRRESLTKEKPSGPSSRTLLPLPLIHVLCSPYPGPSTFVAARLLQEREFACAQRGVWLFLRALFRLEGRFVSKNSAFVQIWVFEGFPARGPRRWATTVGDRTNWASATMLNFFVSSTELMPRHPTRLVVHLKLWSMLSLLLWKCITNVPCG